MAAPRLDEGELAATVALRDKAGVTRLLVLAELDREPGTTLTDVARRLDVTVQAVSTYAQALAEDGLVATGEQGYHVTPRGLQTLHEGIRRLRGALDAVAARLNVIRVTSAVAAARIAAGERVGLFMEEGDLVAHPRARSTSTGRASNAASPGDEVVVTELSGVVELEPGTLTVVVVPGPLHGGIARVDAPRLRALLKDAPKPRKTGAVGTGARILAQRLFGPVDFDFAAERAAFNAAERGLRARLFVTRDRLPDVMQAFDQLNAGTLRRVPIELVDAPEAGA